MKTIILRKTVGYLLLSMCMLSGCDDEAFLKENPLSFYTVDNIISSSDQVDQMITTCYVRVRNIYCPYDNYSELAVWSYRMGNGTDVFDVPTIRNSYRLNDYSILNSQTDVFNATYSAFYYLINSANNVLYASEKATWESPEKKAYVEAQARFFRAFAYRNLGELFGGVPLVKEVTFVPRYDYARASRMETYRFAIDELEAIQSDLPVTTPEAGRLVRAAAQHNLCQLYIDMGVLLAESGGDAGAAYRKALDYANDIIDGGVYRLMTERFGSRKEESPDFYFSNNMAGQTPDHLYSAAGYKAEGNVYWDLFQEGNQDYRQGNTEAIWVAQSDYNVKKTDGKKAGLMYSGIYGPVFRDQAATHVSGAMEDVGGFGMVQVMPTAYTRDLIYEGKWGDDMRNSEAVFRRIFYGNEPSSEYYGKPVPWSVLYKEQNGVPDDAAYTQLYPASCKIVTDKYTGIADGENRTVLYRDDYLIRLPETILLRAEIKWRLGDIAGAASDINLLRTRAQCGYQVAASDVSIDLILDERARELVYEESRWNTLLRMGGTIATERIKKYSYWDYPRNTLTKNFNLWPVPQTVIDTNKDIIIEQNPDWK
ncbi:MAG: RagB/SusD family nutrient uptake outer membrane protein [Tannerella sp.]|nr:RagB/SusD family nutrient uptake outer membrane protein [Tannerella sp.]